MTRPLLFSNFLIQPVAMRSFIAINRHKIKSQKLKISNQFKNEKNKKKNVKK